MTRTDKAELMIVEPYKVPSSLYDGKLTKTSQFLLPLIDLDITRRKISRYFENAFLDDMEYKHSIPLPIFVLWKIKNLEDEDWQSIIKYLMVTDNFVADYYIGEQDGYHLHMTIFSVNYKDIDIYVKFKKGQYSKFPEEYKKKFSQFITDNKGGKKESIMWGAMYKSELLKKKVENDFNIDDKDYPKEDDRGKLVLDPEKDEYWEKPRKEREYYRYKK